MNDSRYVDFFHASNAGNYKLMFIELGYLFDPDTRTASFRNLKRHMKERCLDSLIEKVDATLGQYSALVSSILTIRSKLIAHKELGVGSAEVHVKNGVIPNRLKELINECCSLLNEINSELFGVKGVMLATESARFERATFSLLDVLHKGRT